MSAVTGLVEFLLDVSCPLIETAYRKRGCAGALMVLAVMALIGVLMFRLIAD